jgi:hypothetical protein
MDYNPIPFREQAQNTVCQFMGLAQGLFDPGPTTPTPFSTINLSIWTITLKPTGTAKRRKPY